MGNGDKTKTAELVKLATPSEFSEAPANTEKTEKMRRITNTTFSVM